MFDWNDLRYFLELQRSGRLLTAAKRLNTTHSTVARHIEAIEQPLGTALFVQHAQGYELTPAGQALLKHAEAMENVALLARKKSPIPPRPWARSAWGSPKASASCSLPARCAACLSVIRGWKWNWWRCRALSASSTARPKSASTWSAPAPTC
jgi:DNA-binding transcriptional LysR family regulator